MTLQQHADAIIFQAMKSVEIFRGTLPIHTHSFIGTGPCSCGVRPLVTICGWCPDAKERTLALTMAGNDVSHGMCPRCVIRNGGDLSTRALLEQEP